MLSNVTGAGLPQLKTLLNCLPTSQGGSKYMTDAPLEFSISDVFSVPFAGSVAVSRCAAYRNCILTTDAVKTSVWNYRLWESEKYVAIVTIARVYR